MKNTKLKHHHKNYRADDSIAIRKINAQNVKFWREQSKLADERMSNEAVLQIAISDVRSETERLIPVVSRKSFELALADAWNAKRLFHANLSRKGRSARNPDALQNLILTFAREDSDITERKLLHKLRTVQGAGIIVSIDSGRAERPLIRFVDRHGTPKTAPVRGLKDRLLRAKAKINSL